uniref:Uncharacterized protein n=1 Tax=Mycena chlorophos TaxID=658473 RepID=A0ABQ0LB36_MYCCL|nr:predicted protein [Mycena chlorophos]
MLRARYTAVPTSDEDEDALEFEYNDTVSRLRNLNAGTPHSPAFFADEDEEGMLTRIRPESYPHDPRFDVPTPPAWQRMALLLSIPVAILLAFSVLYLCATFTALRVVPVVRMHSLLHLRTRLQQLPLQSQKSSLDFR